MPIVSYCKKCKKEVPVSDICMSCGKKLPKTSQRLSWYYENTPVKDWISWNNVMRIFLPVFIIMVLLVFTIEGIGKGKEGIAALFLHGLLGKLLLVGGLLAGGLFLILLFQGKEVIQTILDHQGIHTYVFITKPTKLKWRLRLQSPKKKEGQWQLADCVEEKHLLWKDIKGLTLWQDKWKILLYHPRFWVALPIHCTPFNYEEVLIYIHEKLKKKKGIHIHPPLESVIGPMV